MLTDWFNLSHCAWTELQNPSYLSPAGSYCPLTRAGAGDEINFSCCPKVIILYGIYLLSSHKNKIYLQWVTNVRGHAFKERELNPSWLVSQCGWTPLLNSAATQTGPTALSSEPGCPLSGLFFPKAPPRSCRYYSFPPFTCEQMGPLVLRLRSWTSGQTEEIVRHASGWEEERERALRGGSGSTWALTLGFICGLQEGTRKSVAVWWPSRKVFHYSGMFCFYGEIFPFWSLPLQLIDQSNRQYALFH